MANPTVTARQTPPGEHMNDGFKTLYAFAADPNVSFWEKEVQPPGVSVGDAIPTSTMHNTTWRTKAPKQLKELTDGSMTVAYSPEVYDQIVALIGVETSVTVHEPDESSVSFYGYLQDFIPDPHQEGQQPTAKATVVPTNWDPVNNVEVGPLYTAPSGT